MINFVENQPTQDMPNQTLSLYLYLNENCNNSFKQFYSIYYFTIIIILKLIKNLLNGLSHRYNRIYYILLNNLSLE